MLVTKENIQKYIPQKAPIIMIDTIVSNTEIAVETEFVPTGDNIFTENGFFTAPGIIENMAQTCAAKAGYEAFLLNQKPAIGFIAAIKNLKIYFLPHAGSKLVTTMTATAVVMQFTIAQIQVTVDGNTAAACEMKIFLQSEN